MPDATVLMHAFVIAPDCVGLTLPGMMDEFGSHVPWAATAHPDHSCSTVSEFATDGWNASIGYDLLHVHV